MYLTKRYKNIQKLESAECLGNQGLVKSSKLRLIWELIELLLSVYIKFNQTATCVVVSWLNPRGCVTRFSIPHCANKISA